MGNYLCGEYVILNVDESKINANENKTSLSDTAQDDALLDAGVPDGGGGDAQLSLLELSRRIQRQMMSIQGDFITPIEGEAGSLVDYDGIIKSPAYSEYLKTVRLLAGASLVSLQADVDERKAFFINVYNALNVHGIIARGGLPDSLTAKVGYWKRTGYMIDGLRFTLDDIEHGILRGNSRAASQLIGNTYFSRGDPRAQYALKKDPRIHFALNCGARSCPAIRVYDPQNLERGLAGATRSFCASEVIVIAKGDNAVEVQLSHLFKWFRGDFVPADDDDGLGKADPVLRWIVQTTQGSTPLESLDTLGLALEKGKVVTIQYKPYDWTSNKR